MDPQAILDHNAAVTALWADYAQQANERVPIVIASDEALWLKLTGETFRRFYEDPRVQLNVQLEGTAWFADNIVHDRPMGPPPDAWTVAPRFWMDEAEFFGCEVEIQQDTYAWSRPLPDRKPDLLARLADIDPVARVQETSLWALHVAMKDLCAGLTWRGLPVNVAFPGGGTLGVLTVACHVRGAEAMCLDLAEDPDFAFEFLGLLTEKIIGRIAAWHQLLETGAQLPGEAWGMCDDSLQFISADTYRRSVLPHHERIYSAMTTGLRTLHLCGHSAQHFRALYDLLGITVLDGPGPFVDHGAFLAEMPKLSFNGQVDHTALLLGPPSAIDEMLRGVLTASAKQPGRLNLMGYVGPETPRSHLEAMYDAGKRHGRLAP